MDHDGLWSLSDDYRTKAVAVLSPPHELALFNTHGIHHLQYSYHQHVVPQLNHLCS